MQKYDITIWAFGSGSIKLETDEQQTVIKLTEEERAGFFALAGNIWRDRQDSIKRSTVPVALADFSEEGQS